MVDYKNKELWKHNSSKGEIIYSNHAIEFSKFYEQHKELCDSISGLKFNVDGEERVIINKFTFNLGINKLRAFIITYDYSLNDNFQRNKIKDLLRDLEYKFSNDSDYKSFVVKGSNISISSEVEFNKLYLKYLFEVFEIIFLLSSYLQTSLNLSSKEIVKSINFVDYDNFFKHFNHYRDENSKDIANIKYYDLYDNYKKVIGFFYTYRYLMRSHIGIKIKSVLLDLFNELTSEDTTKKIIKLKGGDLVDSKKKELNSELFEYKEVIGLVYRWCYFELQGKNILPKNIVGVVEDNTLI